MEIRTQSGQVMLESEFRAYTLAHGGPSWGVTTPQILSSLGAVALLEGAQPFHTRYQTVQRQGVEQIDGKWYTKYVAVDISDEAKTALNTQQAASVRQARDDKLKATDWMVIRSAETSVALAAEWATYRQALRDVSKQQGFPWEVQWPEQPTA